MGEVTRRLTAAGWALTGLKERGYLNFAKQEFPDVIFRLGLSWTDTPGYHVCFTASCGIEHPETNRLTARFKGRPASSAQGVALVGASLVDLRNDHREPGTERKYAWWLIREPDDIGPVAARLCDDIATYGDPFFQATPTLELMVDQLEQEDKQHWMQGRHGRFAVASALVGKMPQALEALARYAKFTQVHHPRFSAQTWHFVRSFVEHFGIESSSLPFTIGPCLTNSRGPGVSVAFMRRRHPGAAGTRLSA